MQSNAFQKCGIVENFNHNHFLLDHSKMKNLWIYGSATKKRTCVKERSSRKHGEKGNLPTRSHRYLVGSTNFPSINGYLTLYTREVTVTRDCKCWLFSQVGS